MCGRYDSLVSVCPRAALDENTSQLKRKRSELRVDEIEFKYPKIHLLLEKGKGQCSTKVLPRQHEFQGQRRSH